MSDGYPNYPSWRGGWIKHWTLTTTVDEVARTVTREYSDSLYRSGLGIDMPSPAHSTITNLDEDWVQDYRVCRMCGKPVTAERLGWAMHKHEKPCCSPECYAAEELKRHACCDKAKRYGCVCAYATTCPEHGVRHFGTHD